MSIVGKIHFSAIFLQIGIPASSSNKGQHHKRCTQTSQPERQQRYHALTFIPQIPFIIVFIIFASIIISILPIIVILATATGWEYWT